MTYEYLDGSWCVDLELNKMSKRQEKKPCLHFSRACRECVHGISAMFISQPNDTGYICDLGVDLDERCEHFKRVPGK